MCGRYVLRSPLQNVMDAFSAVLEIDGVVVKPRYNIAPTQNVPVIRLNPEGKRTISILKWGLIPSWSKDPAIGSRMINARAETLTEKPSYRNAFRKRRCIVPADGFFEWKKEGKEKQPYYIHPAENSLIGFAGLWEKWGNGDETIESYTIITTEPGEVTKEVHDRMPLILNPSQYEKWLSTEESTIELETMLYFDESISLVLTPVGKQVNSARYDGEDCIVGV